MNVLVGRVRLGAVKNNSLEAGFLDIALDLVCHAQLGQAGIGNDQEVRGPQGLRLITGLLGGANAHE